MKKIRVGKKPSKTLSEYLSCTERMAMFGDFFLRKTFVLRIFRKFCFSLDIMGDCIST